MINGVRLVIQKVFVAFTPTRAPTLCSSVAVTLAPHCSGVLICFSIEVLWTKNDVKAPFEDKAALDAPCRWVCEVLLFLFKAMLPSVEQVTCVSQVLLQCFWSTQQQEELQEPWSQWCSNVQLFSWLTTLHSSQLEEFVCCAWRPGMTFSLGVTFKIWAALLHLVFVFHAGENLFMWWIYQQHTTGLNDMFMYLGLAFYRFI